MKRTFPIILMSLFTVSGPALAQYKLQRHQWVHAGIGPFTAEQMQRAIEETDAALAHQGRRVYVIDNTSKKANGVSSFKVLGLTEQQVLEQLHDDNGATCSKQHQQGDIGNRWCHAAVVKIVDRSLRAQGLNPALAAAVGAAFFVPKELLIDKNPSRSDLVTADIRTYTGKQSNIEVSVFGDGAIYIVLQKKF